MNWSISWPIFSIESLTFKEMFERLALVLFMFSAPADISPMLDLIASVVSCKWWTSFKIISLPSFISLEAVRTSTVLSFMTFMESRIWREPSFCSSIAARMLRTSWSVSVISSETVLKFSLVFAEAETTSPIVSTML